MEESITQAMLDLISITNKYQHFQQSYQQSGGINQSQNYQPTNLVMQILGETREYLKVLEMVTKYLRGTSAHTYLKKGPQITKAAGSSYNKSTQFKFNQADVNASQQQQIDLPPGFKSKLQLDQFIQFFNSYVRRTPRIIEICLKIASNEQFLQDTSKLKFFRVRFKKVLAQTIQRCYKSIIILCKLFPEARSSQDESIFDKIYLIQVLLQSLNSSQYQSYLKQSKSQECEDIANKIIMTGGTKTKTVKEISETSKVLKEKMDAELKEILHQFEIKAEFFITSQSIKKIWRNNFSGQYRVSLDLFIQAFTYNFGSNILTPDNIENLKWLFNAQRDETDPEDKLNYVLFLENIVNITDFIQFSSIMRMFEPDQFDLCLEKLRQESSIGHLYIQDETISRLSESINAKYLSRDIAKIQLKTIFVRTTTDIKKNLDLLLIMHLFGMKNVYLDYREKILHEIISSEYKLGAHSGAANEMRSGDNIVSSFDQLNDPAQKLQVSDIDDPQKAISIQSLIQMNIDAFQEGSVSRKFNDLATASYMSTFLHKYEDEKEVMEKEIKRDRNYLPYDRRNSGYLVTFEHENEVAELLLKKSNHQIFADILNEKEYKLPYYIEFEVLNDYCKGKLFEKLFSFSTLKDFDLIQLKHIIQRNYEINQFELIEVQKAIKRNQEKYLVRRKYFELYLMVGNISIDGFKRERYILKVKDFSDDILKTQRQLNDEEQRIENFQSGNSITQPSFRKQKTVYTNETFGDNLQKITQLLLKIETLEENKRKLQEKLTLKEKKWIENDKLFKERRFTLMAVLQQDLALVVDVSKHLLYLETIAQRRVSQHEKCLLMINQVFAKNRVQSNHFLSEIELLVKDKQDQLWDLKYTYNDLIGKNQQIELEQQSMKKQIEEMINLGNLRRERDKMLLDIQDQELRIVQLKKYLGITDKNKSRSPAGRRPTQQTNQQLTSSAITKTQNSTTILTTSQSKQLKPNITQSNLEQIVEEDQKKGWDRVKDNNRLKVLTTVSALSARQHKQSQDGATSSVIHEESHD